MGGATIGGKSETAFVHGSGQSDTDIEIQWDLDNDGDYSEAEETITGDVIAASARAGRNWPSLINGKAGPGVFKATLRNDDGRYGFFNKASPLNTPPFSLKSGRRLRVVTAGSNPTTPALLARDRFLGSGSLGSTENGVPWVIQSGAFKRSGGAAEADARGTIATVDLGTSDYYLQTRLERVDFSNSAGLVYRFDDNQNFGWIYLYNTTLVHQVQVADVNTVVGSVNIERRPNTHVGVLVSGADATIYYDGVPVMSHTGGAIASASTLAGIGGTYAAQRYPRYSEFYAWDTVHADQDGELWAGEVTSIIPAVTRDGRQIANLTAEGNLSKAAGVKVTAPVSGGDTNISAGSKSGELVGNVLGKAGLLHPPGPIAEGTFKLGAVGLNSASALSLARQFEEAEFGYLYETRGGAIGFEDRASRADTAVRAVFSDRPGSQFSPESVTLLDWRREIINQVEGQLAPQVATFQAQTYESNNAAGLNTAVRPRTSSTIFKAGDLAIAFIVSSVWTKDELWVTPIGWTNLREAADAYGRMRLYAKKVTASDLDQEHFFYDDAADAGGAWFAKMFAVSDWYGSVEGGISVADPSGFGLPDSATQARSGENDPPSIFPPWGPVPSLLLALRSGIGSTADDGTVSAGEDSAAPHGYTNLAADSMDATKPGADIGYNDCSRVDSVSIENPSSFLGDFSGFDYVETTTIAIRGFAGSPPAVTGGETITADNTDSQLEHGGIKSHTNPAKLFPDADAANEYNNLVLARYADDRPILRVGFTASKSEAYRAQAARREQGDKIHMAFNGRSNMGIDEAFTIESVAHRWSMGERHWAVEWELAPASSSAGADVNDETDPDTPDPPDPDPEYLINTPWPLETYNQPDVSVSNGGTLYSIPAGVGSQTAFSVALSSMNSTGGNVIYFEDGQHSGEYRVRGSVVAGGSAPNGIPGAHNVVTAHPNAVVTGVQQGGFPYPAIDVNAANHWDIIGVTVDGSDFQCVRYMSASGTAGSRCRIEGNTLKNATAAHLKIRGWFESPRTPSRFIDVIGNLIDGGTVSRSIPEYSEGIYLGTGESLPADPEWIDETDNILIAKNTVLRIQSDALELKTGVDHVVIEDNLFYSCDLVAGTGSTSIPVGHVSLVYANSAQTGGDVASDVIFRRNRMYSMNQDTGSVRAPLLLCRGGQQAYSNIIWDVEHSAPIEINSGAGGVGTGTIVISHNTGDKTLVSNVDSYGSVTTENNVPDQFAASFVGPTNLDADNGQGAGSGFAITTQIGAVVSGTSYNDATDTAPNSPADPGALAAV